MGEIKKSLLSIPVMFEKTDDLIFDDGRFTKVKIWLMHLGENVNGSVFEKEVVDKALPTLAYIPIVGFIEKDDIGEDDFSGHRYIIFKDKNGYKRKYAGSAYGVVLSSDDNNVHYEDRECDDGITRTFVVVDGVMWNMFDDSAGIINRDLIKSHSMELYDEIGSFDGYEDENGLFHFTEFSFRAACILGNKYEPAMMNSTVEVQFTMNDFVKNLQSELNDKYTAFTKLVIEQNNQGGIEKMPNTDFTQTVLEQFSDISTIVSQYETVVDGWGCNVPRFYLQDIQDNEVIVVDRQNGYKYFGYQFTMNGDKAEIDFTSGNRKKLRYENYEDGADEPEVFDFGKHISSIESVAFAKVNEANEKLEIAENANSSLEADKNTAETNYNQIKADYDEMKPKYDAYVQADLQREKEAQDAEKDAKFAEYEDALSENTDFAALKERKDELSVDDIEKECAVLYVKVNRAKTNFEKSNGGAAIVGVLSDNSGDKNGYVQTKYGMISVMK